MNENDKQKMYGILVIIVMLIGVVAFAVALKYTTDKNAERLDDLMERIEQDKQTAFLPSECSLDRRNYSLSYEIMLSLNGTDVPIYILMECKLLLVECQLNEHGTLDAQVLVEGLYVNESVTIDGVTSGGTISVEHLDFETQIEAFSLDAIVEAIFDLAGVNEWTMGA